MKQNQIWKLLLLLGLVPFLLPVCLGLYRMRIETWTMVDWLVLYSFLYWPTYLVGLLLIVISVYKLTHPTTKDET